MEIAIKIAKHVIHMKLIKINVLHVNLIIFYLVVLLNHIVVILYAKLHALEDYQYNAMTVLQGILNN